MDTVCIAVSRRLLRIRLARLLVISFVVGFPSAASADVPPTITFYEFDEAFQLLSFEFDSHGKNGVIYGLDTSINADIHTPPEQIGQIDTDTGGEDWSIEPGVGSEIDDIHFFTIVISNENGYDQKTIDLVVVEGPLRSLRYAVAGPIPTVSEWGMTVMAVLVLTAGTIVIGRRRRRAAA